MGLAGAVLGPLPRLHSLSRPWPAPHPQETHQPQCEFNREEISMQMLKNYSISKKAKIKWLTKKLGKIILKSWMFSLEAGGFSGT